MVAHDLVLKIKACLPSGDDSGFLPASFFGFAFVKAWNDIAFQRFALFSPEDALLGRDAFLVCMLAGFVFMLVLARRIVPLYEKKWGMPLATTFLMLSAALSFVAAPLQTHGSPVSEAFSFLSIVLGGIGASFSILLWAEFQSCLDPLRMILCISGSFFLGAIIAWVCLGLDGTRLVLILLVLPAFSYVNLKSSFSKVARRHLPKRTWGPIRFPWEMMVVLGIYQFIFGLRGSSAAFEDAPILWATAVVSAMLFMGVALFSSRFDFAVVYRTPFLLMVCGLLMGLLAFSSSGVIAEALISGGYSLMFLILTITLCDISHRYGISVLVLCGIQELSLVFVVLGHAFSRYLASESHAFPLNDAELTAVLVMLVVAASVTLLLENKKSTEWGLAFFGGDGIAKNADQEKGVALRCDEIAKHHGLSPREKEVLELLARRRKLSQIENELHIAPGTLKSHKQRIYRKLQIHSKDELYELFEL